MDDWQKNWWQQVEEISENLEKFSRDINQAIDSFSEEISEVIEDLGEQIRESVEEEIESCLEDFNDFLTENQIEIEFDFWSGIENFTDDFDFVEVTQEQPRTSKNPACIGCNHYHGQAYNGQILVCGMHPYGVESDHCLDWEKQA